MVNNEHERVVLKSPVVQATLVPFLLLTTGKLTDPE